MNSIGLPFVQLASTTPLFLIWVVGIVFSVLRLRESRNYWLVLIAMGLFLMAELGGALGNAALITAFQRDGASSVRLAFLLGVVGFVPHVSGSRWLGADSGGAVPATACTGRGVVTLRRERLTAPHWRLATGDG